jgi:hypothetical protein
MHQGRRQLVGNVPLVNFSKLNSRFWRLVIRAKIVTGFGLRLSGALLRTVSRALKIQHLKLGVAIAVGNIVGLLEPAHIGAHFKGRILSNTAPNVTVLAFVVFKRIGGVELLRVGLVGPKQGPQTGLHGLAFVPSLGVGVPLLFGVNFFGVGIALIFPAGVGSLGGS